MVTIDHDSSETGVEVIADATAARRSCSSA
jgi:hypothetical protein